MGHYSYIDMPMFDALLRAELVIADISTGNANALYELGVRHALKPFSTIIMKESQGKFFFDLNHINTFQYHHLGEDIGASEARRAAAELQNLIEQVLINPVPDSPVYTFIPKLVQPKLSEAEFEALVSRSIATEAAFSELMLSGERALRETDFTSAVNSFEAALTMKPGDVYLTQQLALSTYKSKRPSEISALVQALKIIESLSPEKSNDPETLGITGAIHKRLWNITSDTAELDLAILYYGRGFDIRRDYYSRFVDLAYLTILESHLKADPAAN